MFVVPFEPCAKCYALAFKSKLFSQAIPLITITVVITNIKKQKHRSAKKQFCNNLNLNDNPNVRDGTGVSMVFVKT